MRQYLYRVVVTSFPEGSHTDDGYRVEDWSPEGWQADEGYLRILGTAEFIWPVSNKRYFSRSTANKRAQLLRRYGATAEVQRSSEITWPEEA